MIPAAGFTVDRIVRDRDGVPSVRLRAGELADFSRDWSHQLPGSEVILGSGWTSDSGGILTHGKTAKVATVWLDAAELDIAEGAEFAVLVNSIETSAGRRDSWTMRVYPPDE